MAIYIPYFYIIQDVRNDMYYAGSKYGKDANPDNFMVEGGYITSSNTINESIKQNGLKNFIIRKIRTFKTAGDAYNYETRFLRRIDAAAHPRFYNKHNNERPSWGSSEMNDIMMEKYGVIWQMERNRGKTYNEIYGEDKSILIKCKMSKSRSGEGNGMYGKKHKLKTKNKISKKAKIRNQNLKGLKNEEIFGKEMAQKIGKKISDANHDFYENRKGKTYEELYGEERAREIKKKLSKSPSSETREKISIKNKGRKQSPETCEKNRINALKRIKKECPHCNRFFDPGNFKQFHGDKCKYNIENEY